MKCDECQAKFDEYCNERVDNECAMGTIVMNIIVVEEMGLL